MWSKMRFEMRQPYATAAEKQIEEIVQALPIDDREKLLKAVKDLRGLEFEDGRDDTQFNGW